MANREVILGVLHNQFNNINDCSSSSLLSVDCSKAEFNHTVATCLISPPRKELFAKEMVGCSERNRGCNLQEGVIIVIKQLHSLRFLSFHQQFHNQLILHKRTSAQSIYSRVRPHVSTKC